MIEAILPLCLSVVCLHLGHLIFGPAKFIRDFIDLGGLCEQLPIETVDLLGWGDLKVVVGKLQGRVLGGEERELLMQKRELGRTIKFTLLVLNPHHLHPLDLLQHPPFILLHPLYSLSQLCNLSIFPGCFNIHDFNLLFQSPYLSTSFNGLILPVKLWNVKIGRRCSKLLS